MKQQFEIGPPDAGRHIERYLQSALGSVPFSLVQRLLRRGDVRRNGKRARSGETLAAGDQVVVHRRTTSKPEAVAAATGYRGPSIQVLLRDADFLALNKPAGARCSEDQQPELSIAAWLREHLRAEIENGLVRPELCHRLDHGTTGVVLVALHAAAFTRFHRALAEQRLRKVYHVAVFGRPRVDQWVDTTPLRRLPHAPRGRPKVVAAPVEGEAATTRFRLLSTYSERSLLEAEPISGRTHQIRAHLYASGLPLLGDPRYGDRLLERALPKGCSIGHPMLHARQIELELAPAVLFATAPYPAEFEQALQRLGLLQPA